MNHTNNKLKNIAIKKIAIKQQFPHPPCSTFAYPPGFVDLLLKNYSSLTVVGAKLCENFQIVDNLLSLTFADPRGGIQEVVPPTVQHTVALQGGVGLLAPLTAAGTVTLRAVIVAACGKEGKNQL